MMLESGLAPPPPPGPSSPPPPLSPPFAAEIENTPWFAVRIDPTWLPESAANRSADARAFRVASVIMSGFRAFSPLTHTYPCPFRRSQSQPAAPRLLPRRRDLVHVLQLTVTVCCTITAARYCCSRHTIGLYPHLYLPHRNLLRRHPLRRKKLQHRILVLLALREHLRQVVPCLLKITGHTAESDFTVRSTSPFTVT